MTSESRLLVGWLRALLIAIPGLGIALGALALGPAAVSGWAELLPFASGVSASGLSSAAEVVAAVLAVAITVVAIVVELAATRYTHQITHLFVREPVNFVVMAFYVFTTLLCLWISLGDESSSAPVGAALVLCTLCLLLLLPYFGFVFAFLGPANIIEGLRVRSLDGARRAMRGMPARGAAQLLEGAEEIEDLTLNAIHRSDRGIAVAAAGALARLLHDYGLLRPSLPEAWFRQSRLLANDPDFASLEPSETDEIAARGTWVEVKVLRQFHSLFTHSVGRVPDVPAAIAIHTASLAERAARNDPALLDLTLRFLNSYMRSAINAGDVRSAYYLLQQCRRVLGALINEGLHDRALNMTGHLRYYGRLAAERGIPFVTETLAFDLALLVDDALRDHDPIGPALLGALLQLDWDEEGPRAHESGLRGVLRAQVQLAARCLARGDRESAERIRADMSHERPELLAAVRDEILAAHEPRYWEFTDRAANFAWVPPEVRPHVVEYFEGFGFGATEASG